LIAEIARIKTELWESRMARITEVRIRLALEQKERNKAVRELLEGWGSDWSVAVNCRVSGVVTYFLVVRERRDDRRYHISGIL
jgi:hypothetical protein